MRKNKPFDTLRILTGNAWEWLCYNKDKLSTTDEYTQYKATFLGNSYSSTIIAVISDLPDHLQLDGHYGVLWLEAIYEYDRAHSYDELADMQSAIIVAERNLLRIGMPFTKDYKFHGKDAANMKRRNEKLRRVYDLEEKERRGMTSERTGQGHGYAG